MELMRVKGITKSFLAGERELQVLKDVDLTIEQGDFMSLMGVSGSGKSTFLNILGSMDSPNSGEIWMHGKNICSMNENDLAAFRLNHIGFVFQFHYLLPEFTVEENVAMPLMVKGMNKSHALKKANEMLGFMSLSKRKGHYPSQISGGEKQRAAIARALINEPDILLADEPTGNLDQATGDIVMDLFQKIHSEMNQTFFLVTHNKDIAARAQINFNLEASKLVKI